MLRHMPHHVIYVPGLGDNNGHGQETLPDRWRKLDVAGHYLPLIWNDKQPFQPKLQRLLDKIDELSADGPVSLVGTSAGASAVLIACALRPQKVSGVVCLCGKINHPETVRPERYAENPAFREALAQLQKVLPDIHAKYANRILSIHPLYDGVVPIADTYIPGARNKLVPLVGHVFSIAMVLLFGSAMLMRFLKNKVVVQ